MTDEKHRENGRVIKFFILPTMLISFIMAFILPEFRTAGMLYFLMSVFSLNIFSMPRFKEEVYGIKAVIAAPLFIGAGTGIGFLILSAISPAFSLLTPSLSLSISSDIRWFIIVWIAPIAEEAFRASTIGLLRDVYPRWKFTIVNIIQALVFASLHIFVYGIGLGALQTWSAAYGTFLAVSGSLLAAFLFGLIAGYMMHRMDNITPSILSHMIINGWLVAKGFIVVS